ncbi:hypothetical protein NOVOSPHI9U_210009 [Novosphingobium sp. 9U]|nr:hypothetical protein NOVOSPHI9U_210009 [Novosphingobium sp. 9U]
MREVRGNRSMPARGSTTLLVLRYPERSWLHKREVCTGRHMFSDKLGKTSKRATQQRAQLRFCTHQN